MRLPSYLRPWRRCLVGAAVVGFGAGGVLSVALVGADRTGGTVALAQFLLLAALVSAVFYLFLRGVVLFLRRLWLDPDFARAPDAYPEVFAVASVALVVASTCTVLTWAGLGRGFIL